MPADTDNAVRDPQTEPVVSDDKWPLIAAILFLLGLFTAALATLAGLILAYMKKGEAAGSYGRSIYIYLIRTFWIGMLFTVLSILLSFVGIGILLGAVTSVWYVIRVVKATIAAADKRPIDNPQTWMV